MEPDPDWAGAFAGAFGTVQNLIEADVFFARNLIETSMCGC